MSMTSTEPHESQDLSSPPPFGFFAFLIANVAVASCFWLPWTLLSFFSPGGWTLYVIVFVSMHIFASALVLTHYCVIRKCFLPAITIIALLLCWHTFYPEGNYVESFTPPMQSSAHTQWGFFGYARVMESENESSVAWFFDLAQFLVHLEYANNLVLLYAFGLGLRSETWRKIKI